MKIIKPGESVKILKSGIDSIYGIVEEVLITPNESVQYKVLWWSGRDRKSEWLYEHSVVKIYNDNEYIQIGFM